MDAVSIHQRRRERAILSAHLQFEQFREAVRRGQEMRASVAWARVCRARARVLALSAPHEVTG